MECDSNSCLVRNKKCNFSYEDNIQECVIVSGDYFSKGKGEKTRCRVPCGENEKEVQRCGCNLDRKCECKDGYDRYASTGECVKLKNSGTQNAFTTTTSTPKQARLPIDVSTPKHTTSKNRTTPKNIRSTPSTTTSEYISNPSVVTTKSAINQTKNTYAPTNSVTTTKSGFTGYPTQPTAGSRPHLSTIGIIIIVIVGLFALYILWKLVMYCWKKFKGMLHFKLHFICF